MKLLQTIILAIMISITGTSNAANKPTNDDALSSKLKPLLNEEKVKQALPVFAQIEESEPTLSEPLPGGFKDCANCPEMIVIPGKNYAMGKYEVTQGQWRAIMGSDSNPSRFFECGDNCPVENITWHKAQEFIQKLNAKTRKQYRLPTEAEWEYVCYGGNQTEYCGGNNLDAVGWYGNNAQPGGNSGLITHPVGQKQANFYGLYDMSGNVWEWVEDKYDNKSEARVLRGGSLINDPSGNQAAFRYLSDPAHRSGSIGFRLVRTLP